MYANLNDVYATNSAAAHLFAFVMRRYGKNGVHKLKVMMPFTANLTGTKTMCSRTITN
jgi:hypothetical protein